MFESVQPRVLERSEAERLRQGPLRASPRPGHSPVSAIGIRSALIWHLTSDRFPNAYAALIAFARIAGPEGPNKQYIYSWVNSP